MSAVVPPWPKLMIGPNVGIVRHLDLQFPPTHGLALHQQRRIVRVARRASRRAAVMTSAASCRSSANPPAARPSGRTL